MSFRVGSYTWSQDDGRISILEDQIGRIAENELSVLLLNQKINPNYLTIARGAAYARFLNLNFVDGIFAAMDIPRTTSHLAPDNLLEFSSASAVFDYIQQKQQEDIRFFIMTPQTMQQLSYVIHACTSAKSVQLNFSPREEMREIKKLLTWSERVLDRVDKILANHPTISFAKEATIIQKTMSRYQTILKQRRLLCFTKKINSRFFTRSFPPSSVAQYWFLRDRNKISHHFVSKDFERK